MVEDVSYSNLYFTSTVHTHELATKQAPLLKAWPKSVPIVPVFDLVVMLGYFQFHSFKTMEVMYYTVMNDERTAIGFFPWTHKTCARLLECVPSLCLQ